jgi:hypothetical protein
VIETDNSDVAAIIAVLKFILENAAKFSVDQEVLFQELEQLGIPTDICKSIRKVYATNKDVLRTKQLQHILKSLRLLQSSSQSV